MTEHKINLDYAKCRIKKVVFDLYKEGIYVSVVDEALGETKQLSSFLSELQSFNNGGDL